MGNLHVVVARVAVCGILLVTSFSPLPYYHYRSRGCISIESGSVQRTQSILDPRQTFLFARNVATREGFEEETTEVVLDDFDDIVEAIRIFRTVFGDFDIPVKFEVPNENPWPSTLQGLRLGRRLEKLLNTEDFFTKHSDKVNELAKMGFRPNSNSLVDDWRIIHDALQIYKDLYGNLRVPAKFEVPDETPWPRYCRTVKLGVRVAAMRSAGRYVKDHPSRKKDLDKLGFEWRLRDNTYKQQVNDEQFELVLEALAVYKGAVDTDLNAMPLDFVVPASSPWPESTHGLQLGEQVKAIRDKDKLIFGNAEREKRLAELGLEIDGDSGGRSVYSKKRFEIVFSGLKVYKQVYGDLMVPQAFVIPEGDPLWPEETQGLKLGARVNAIRCQGTLVANAPERRDMLDQLGFSWELPTHTRRKKKSEESEEDNISAVSVSSSSSSSSSSSLLSPSSSDDILSAFGLKRNMPDVSRSIHLI